VWHGNRRIRSVDINMEEFGVRSERPPESQCCRKSRLVVSTAARRNQNCLEHCS